MKERIKTNGENVVAKRLLAGCAIALSTFTVGAADSYASSRFERSEPVNVAEGPNLVVGDSLTHELSLAARGDYGNPALMEDNGLPYGIPQDGAYVGGATSTYMRTMLVRQNAFAQKYEAAVVEVGANDALPPELVPQIRSDGYTDDDHDNIVRLYRDIARISKCVVAVPPTYNSAIDTAYFGKGREWGVEMSKARQDILENIVPTLKEQGVNIHIADPQNLIQSADALSNDGIHARPLFVAVEPTTGSIGLSARTNVVKDALANC